MNKLLQTLLVIFALFLLSLNLSAHESQKMKALFIWGGWNGHEPAKCRDIFVPWLEENGFEVRVDSTLDVYTDSIYMASLDLIVQIMTMSEISNEQEKGLLTAIENGVNIAGWHGGLADAFREMGLNPPIIRKEENIRK